MKAKILFVFLILNLSMISLSNCATDCYSNGWSCEDGDCWKNGGYCETVGRISGGRPVCRCNYNRKG